MKHKILFVGLGDMGLPMALNLLKAGHEVYGADLRAERREMLEQEGGRGATDLPAAAKEVDTVFLMVMHGAQVHALVLGENGLLANLSKDACIVVTATIRPGEFDALVEPCEKAGVGLIDSPVSGGRTGAEGGSLTLMCSGRQEVLESRAGILDSISARKYVIDEKPGMGMRAKAALQSMFGSMFTAVFEGLALAAKSGVNGQAMLDVVQNSALSSPMVNYCSEQIMDRRFVDTGSTMTTIHKDIGISLDFAREQGVPMHTAAAAFQIFQAAMTAFPGEDNWAGVKVIEQVTGVKVKR